MPGIHPPQYGYGGRVRCQVARDRAVFAGYFTCFQLFAGFFNFFHLFSVREAGRMKANGDKRHEFHLFSPICRSLDLFADKYSFRRPLSPDGNRRRYAMFNKVYLQPASSEISTFTLYFDLFRFISRYRGELFRGISTYFRLFRAISTYFGIKKFPRHELHE